jgi:hypothetical protein
MAISRSELKDVVGEVLDAELPEKSKKERGHLTNEIIDKMVLEFAGDVYEDDDEEDEDLDARLAGHLSVEDSGEED